MEPPVVWMYENTLVNAKDLILRGTRFDDGDVFHVDGAPTLGEMAPPRHGAIVPVTVLGSAEQIAALKAGVIPEDLKSLSDAALVFDASAAYYVTCKFGDVTSLKIRFIPGEAELFSRNVGVVPGPVLKQKCVAVVGIGSGGAPIAVELSKAGIGRFVLVDFERLELANLARHVLDSRDLGRLKTNALRDALRSRNPNVHVISAALDCVSDYAALKKLLQDERCDLLIAGTDSTVSRNHLNHMALELKLPAIFGRTLARSSRGDVFRMRPGGKPCLNCVYGNPLAVPETSEPERAVDVPDYMAPGEVGKVGIHPGLSNDIAPYSQMMTKLAIVELSAGFPGMKLLNEDLSAHMFSWANRREVEDPANAGLTLGLSTSALAHPSNNLDGKWFLTEVMQLVRYVLLEMTGHESFAPVTNTLDSNTEEFYVHFKTFRGSWTLTFGAQFGETGIASLSPQFSSRSFPISFKGQDPLSVIKEALALPEVVAAANDPGALRICRWYGIEVPMGCTECDPAHHSLFELTTGLKEMSPEAAALAPAWLTMDVETARNAVMSETTPIAEPKDVRRPSVKPVEDRRPSVKPAEVVVPVVVDDRRPSVKPGVLAATTNTAPPASTPSEERRGSVKIGGASAAAAVDKKPTPAALKPAGRRLW